MNDQEFISALRARGLPEEDVEWIVRDIASHGDEQARAQAAALLQRIFLRLAADSLWGAALVLALGLERGESLSHMARAHGKTKQYLHDCRKKLTALLGSDLTVLTRHAPPPAEPAAVVDEQSEEPAGDDVDIDEELGGGDLAPMRAAINPDDDDNEIEE